MNRIAPTPGSRVRLSLMNGDLVTGVVRSSQGTILWIQPEWGALSMVRLDELVGWANLDVAASSATTGRESTPNAGGEGGERPERDAGDVFLSAPSPAPSRLDLYSEHQRS